MMEKKTTKEIRSNEFIWNKSTNITYHDFGNVEWVRVEDVKSWLIALHKSSRTMEEMKLIYEIIQKFNELSQSSKGKGD